MDSFTSELDQQKTKLAEATKERTMFITFSKGHVPFEHQVTNFLKKNYGNCIESYKIEDVHEAYGHPLLARVVFFSPSTVDRILHGAVKAKFCINRKHVWMHKSLPQIPRVSKTVDQSTLIGSPAGGEGDRRAANGLVILKSLVVALFGAFLSCFKPEANE